VALTPWISPAVLICHTDSGVRRDGKLCIPQALADAVGKPRQRLVRVVHARREAVANKLDSARISRQLDDLLALGDVHLVDLNTVCPLSIPGQSLGPGLDKFHLNGHLHLSRASRMCSG